MTAPFITVPWTPDSEGREITGRTLRALQLTAEMAAAAGWTAETLRQRDRWHEQSTPAALTRVAVRLGLIR